ncbi:MAG: hypothetical protein EOO01_06220 [Chitinophagaceae bacterium]|nr:MAG: hypothetical protein EOO01_06220 [Chitinophagaceae bacterium]
MFLTQFEISPESRAREIVENDYRAAEVFKRYDINFCCGIQWPLEQACEEKGIGINELVATLKKTCRTVSIPPQVDYNKWPVGFLIDYITNIHHQYLHAAIPDLQSAISRFISKHGIQYPNFNELNDEFSLLVNAVIPHLKHEEETIFPYLRQVANAYDDRATDPLAALLVKTLRKPLASLVETEHGIINRSISRFRELTNNYSIPAGVCSGHRVLLGKLRELDNDLVQHFYLENEILIGKVIKMEEELLQRNS